jgi:hypothetical protein
MDFLLTEEEKDKIKKLYQDNDMVYSEDIPEEHQKTIDRLNNTIFADFDVSKFKERNPPKNDSKETKKELEFLNTLPLNQKQVEDNDRILKAFKHLFDKRNLVFPKKLVRKLIKDSASVIMNLKYHYNRPRPYQLYGVHDLPVKTYIMSSMKTPSYPSGHSTQGILISKVLADLYPELSNELLKKGKEISLSRNIAKAHFPSDSKFGIDLGNEMYEFLKDSEFINKFDGIYQEKE